MLRLSSNIQYFKFINLKLFFIIIVLACIFGFAADAKFKVIDGDTIKINGVNHRLAGINCYEKSKAFNNAYKQAYLQNMRVEEVLKRGKLAKELFKELIKDGFTYMIIGKGCYNRPIINMYNNKNQLINKILADSGYCWEQDYKN
jgi:endonuclease YncB( thermonuclease family)